MSPFFETPFNLELKGLCRGVEHFIILLIEATLSRHVRMHVKLLQEFVLVLRAVSSQIQSSFTSSRLKTTIVIPERRKGSMVVHTLVCKMLNLYLLFQF